MSIAGSASGPSSFACLMTMRPTRKLSPETLPSTASASCDCDTETPSSSIRLNALRAPNSEPISGEPRTSPIFTAPPTETPSNLSSTPVSTDSRAEPIFTGAPIASEAAFSYSAVEIGMTCKAPTPAISSTNSAIAAGLPHFLRPARRNRRHRGLFERRLARRFRQHLLVALDVVHVEVVVRDLDVVVGGALLPGRARPLRGGLGFLLGLLGRQRILRLALALGLLLPALLLFLLRPALGFLLRAALFLLLAATFPLPRAASRPPPLSPCARLPPSPCARPLPWPCVPPLPSPWPPRPPAG